MKMLKKFGKFFRAKKPAVEKALTIQDITIFGYSNAVEGDDLFQSVFEVTAELAKAGYTVIDGGGPGVMLAASMGAKSQGGKVIGVTMYPKNMKNFEGRNPKNILDKEIKTETYVERTLTLLKEGQVYVVFNGGTGTISEFGMAWGLARLYFGHHKPLILYGKFWIKIIKALKENMKIRPEEMKVFKIVDDPCGVLYAISEFEKEIERGEHGEHLKTSKNGFSI